MVMFENRLHVPLVAVFTTIPIAFVLFGYGTDIHDGVKTCFLLFLPIINILAQEWSQNGKDKNKLMLFSTMSRKRILYIYICIKKMFPKLRLQPNKSILVHSGGAALWLQTPAMLLQLSVFSI